MMEAFKEIKRLSDILGFKVPQDGFLMALFGRPIIDIIELDRRLEKDFRYKGSMNDFIRTQFGDEALQLLENNLYPKQEK